MEQKEIRQEMIHLVANVLGIDQAAVEPELPLNLVMGWDSLKQVIVLMAIEKRFAIAFSPKEINSITSLDSIVGVVTGKLT